MRLLRKCIQTIYENLNWNRFWIMLIIFGIPLLAKNVSDFKLNFFTEILIFSINAVSFNLLMGYTGLVSYGQAGFFAVGGYAAAYLLTQFQTNLITSIVGGLGISLLVSLCIGLIFVRLSSVYFSMLTMAFGQLVYLLARKWYSITNGDNGLHGIDRMGFFSSKESFFYLVLFLSVGIFFLFYRIVESPFGFSLRVLRDNRRAINFTGTNAFSVQYAAIVLSGTISGFSGSLYAMMVTSIDPSMASIQKSFEPLLASVIGGVHSFWGPILGTSIFKILETFFGDKLASIWPLLMGGMLVSFTLSWPYGIIGYLQDPRFAIWMWKPTMKGLVLYHDVLFFINEKRERYWNPQK